MSKTIPPDPFGDTTLGCLLGFAAIVFASLSGVGVIVYFVLKATGG